MNARLRTFVLATLLALTARGAEEAFDRLDEALTWSSADGTRRARLSGLLDVEGYALPQPAPAFIETTSHWLFNPRLAVFLDAQLGPNVYLFAQGRADRGFDPSSEGLEARLDEYAVRWAPTKTLRIQVGRFGTIVGNWTPRHDSWTNPFVTAPLPYENLTGVWDNEPPHSAGQLLVWSHVRPGLQPGFSDQEKYLRLPILWGPSYATGVAVAGEVGDFRYAFEMKNASLSSRPEAWDWSENQLAHPTYSGRLRYIPDERWEFGWSGSVGTFLRPMADPLLPRGYERKDFRQIVIGQDVSFAWHHVQVWAEVFANRFEIPLVGSADTLAYYVEAKYKFTARFAGAVRWNQQLYGDIQDRGVGVRWGQPVWRFDVAPIFRFNPALQGKLQYSVQRGDSVDNALRHIVAVQLTLRF